MRFGNNYAINRLERTTIDYSGNETYELATSKGIGIKSAVLIGTTFISTLLWMTLMGKVVDYTLAFILYFGVAIANLVLQLIMAFKPLTTNKLAVPYAILEGLLLGTIIELMGLVWGSEGYAYAGLALMITIAIFLGAAFLYSTGIVKVGTGFRRFMTIALLGLVIGGFAIGIFCLIISLTSGINLWGIYVQSPIAILVSVISIIIASLYVFVTLDNVNGIIERGSDKKYEWLAAYSILLNIVWLFLELLRLFIRLLGRRK